eukprot:SAG11_NODE_1238_length_5425_cov_3.387908_2_plen_168_part_00
MHCARRMAIFCLATVRSLCNLNARNQPCARQTSHFGAASMQDIADLEARVGRIVVGHGRGGASEPVTAADIGGVGAVIPSMPPAMPRSRDLTKRVGQVAALLKDALQPNLVQTLEGNLALVHGGPFANIAHGCNSAVATKVALQLSDYVVTEAVRLHLMRFRRLRLR